MIENHEMVEPVSEQKPVTPAPQPKTKKSAPRPISMQVVGCAKLNLREDADTDSDVIKTLAKGEIVKADPTYKHPTFTKVKAGDDEGYAMTAYLTAI